jgi:hypothetical protein
MVVENLLGFSCLAVAVVVIFLFLCWLFWDDNEEYFT